MQAEERELSCKGFAFRFDPKACEVCGGRCCNGESGMIWVNGGEIRAISGFLEMESPEFIMAYLRKIDYRYSLKELKTEGNYACIFYDPDKNGCSIYPVRPAQCGTFPFWDYYRDHRDELVKECPGIRLT